MFKTEPLNLDLLLFSLDLIFFEIGIHDLFYMLIVLHDHKLVKSVANSEASDIILQWRCIHLTDGHCKTSEEKTSDAHYVEISRLVSFELVVEVLEVILLYRAAVVKALKFLSLWVNCFVFRCHYSYTAKRRR